MFFFPFAGNVVHRGASDIKHETTRVDQQIMEQHVASPRRSDEDQTAEIKEE